jgi:hypothetical protein
VIDLLLALDPGRRGIARFFVRRGAESAARALVKSRRVLITTGFAVGAGLGETDGPPGAASLGRALRLLGKRVTYVADPVAVPLVKAALGALGERADVLTFAHEQASEGRNPGRGRHAPGGPAEQEARRILTAVRPTHLVAVERPGRTGDGDYRSMRAESVRPWNAPVDTMFLIAPRAVVTIGVGDGGNEIGMGNVRARIVRGGGPLGRVASVVRVRHLVVAGTSNWGAYGVIAELSRLTGRSLLHAPDQERAMVSACVQVGAVDGITRRREPTVDGLPLEVHLGMLELLRVFAAPGNRAGTAAHGGSRAAARPELRLTRRPTSVTSRGKRGSPQ